MQSEPVSVMSLGTRGSPLLVAHEANKILEKRNIIRCFIMLFVNLIERPSWLQHPPNYR